MDESRRFASLVAGALAGPLFGISVSVNGALRPGYDPRQHPMSLLSLGERPWVQKATFIAVGGLGLAGASGLKGPGWGTFSLATWSTALIGAGLFDADPAVGYPPGTPEHQGGNLSTAGALHNGISLIGFVALASAATTYAIHFGRRGDRLWSLGSASAAGGFTGFMVTSIAGLAPNSRFTGRSGRFQRAAVGTGFAWTTALTLRELRRALAREA